MTDEKKITIEASLSYEEFCERLSSPASAGLMYAHDVLGRAGLEVLWLKLSLLAEIIGMSRTLRITPNHCHIKLVPAATHLPRFWNTSIEYSPASDDASVQAVLNELGLCWFRTLLANRGQTAAEVDAVLKSLLAASGGNSNVLTEAVVRSPVLQSTQLFLAKELSQANSIPPDLWQRTLQIGLRLATQIPNFSYSSPGESSLDAVLIRVLTDTEALRVRVQTALFIDPPRMDRDLSELLTELIRDPDWLNSLGAVSAAPAVQVVRAALVPADMAATVVTVVTVAEAAPPEEENNMESTIIIKRGAALPSASASIKPPPAVSPTYVVPQAAPAAEENLEATIIISKDKKR